MEINRIFAAIALFAFIIYGPWWLIWCCAIALLFYFKSYYEIILWGVIYDALYGITSIDMWYSRYTFTIFSIILFVIVFFLKKHLIIYDDTH